MAGGGHIVYKNSGVLTWHLTGGAYLTLNAEHGANRIIRVEVIQLFVNFQIMPAAILDFRKCTSGAQRCLGGDEWKLVLKFGENQSKGSEVIQILVIIKKIQNGAGGHLGFRNSTFWFYALVGLAEKMIYVKFHCSRMSG